MTHANWESVSVPGFASERGTDFFPILRKLVLPGGGAFVICVGIEEKDRSGRSMSYTMTPSVAFVPRGAAAGLAFEVEAPVVVEEDPAIVAARLEAERVRAEQAEADRLVAAKRFEAPISETVRRDGNVKTVVRQFADGTKSEVTTR